MSGSISGERPARRQSGASEQMLRAIGGRSLLVAGLLAFAAALSSMSTAGAAGSAPGPASNRDASEGAAIFASRCAQCHEPAIDRAPSLAQLRQMRPEQIFGALHGVMAPMAAGLSEAQKQAVSDYLGKPADAAPAGPASTAAPRADPGPDPAKGKPAPVAATMSTQAPAIPGLTAAANFEWRAYKGNLAAHNYAPLDQINSETIGGLRIAWRQSLTPAAVRAATGSKAEPSGNNQMTPLMVKGLVYISTGVGGVAALDAATGEVVWHVDQPVPAAGAVPEGGLDQRAEQDAVPIGGATRALAYWEDEKGQGRIIALVGNRFLTALDARTGKRFSDFGTNGQVDLAEGREKGGDYFAWLTGPSAIVRGVVIIGSAIEDINDDRRISKIDNPRGDVRGIDVRTGKQLWTWHSIPQEGEFGKDSWEDDSWTYTGGTNVWGAMSGDEELGLVYLPQSSPSNDWYGGKRPGANLFSDSIVALDARTGKRAWHYQVVHHDLWDYDLPCPPVLADIVVDGKVIKALAQPSKQAYLYVLDRTTGKPVWPIVEHPVPVGDAPGEWYSPTQPMPLDAHGNPFAYDQQGVSSTDLIDFTAELRAEARGILDQYAYGPLFYPVVVSGEGLGKGKKGSLHMPSSSGGTNWPGAGLDPETNILYIPSVTATRSAALGPPPEGSDTFLVRTDPARPDGPRGLPLFKPPYGRLVAVDLDLGEILWTAANGDGPRDHPALKDLNLPQLGQPGRVGPLVTKSLVFMGDGMTQSAPGSGGKKFRAFDKATGRVLWETLLPGETTGVPMSYAWKGKQYIVVPIGGPGHPGEFVALSLN